MSDSIYSYNLLPNPKPSDARGYVGVRTTSVTFGGLGVRVGCETANACLDAPITLPSGDYVLCAQLVSVFDTAPGFPVFDGRQEALRMIVNDSTSHQSIFPAEYMGPGWYTVPFTISDAAAQYMQQARFWCAVGKPSAANACRWAHMGILTATDWQVIQSKNIQWFDGDTYLTGGGVAS